MSTTGSSRSKTESRHLIDQKKAELYESIRQLNSERNELAPISALPPELLGRIFTDVMANVVESFFTPGLLNFTYVSQKWRNVALDTPRIWNNPPFLFPTWARVMFERSKMADLVIDANVSLIEGPSLIQEIFDHHATRIREIKFRGLPQSFISSITENVQPSSLSLRTLHLSASGDWGEPGGEEDEIPVFPTHLLAQPDGLQHLTIVGCALNWYAHPHPFLTSLVVMKSSDRPLLSEFVTALLGMPALETLEMSDSLPRATQPVGLVQKIEFPKLSSLLLATTENFFEVLNILVCLIVPCTTRVNLSCIDAANSSSDTVIRFESTLGVFFSGMTGDDDRKLYRQLQLGGQAGVSGWSDEQPNLFFSDFPDLSLSFQPRPYQQAHHMFGEILPNLPTADLRTLVINTNIGQDTILRYFGQSSTIQRVELGSEATVSNFLQALTSKQEGLESAYRSVSFPALHSIYFDWITFDVDELLDCLIERYERGAEVQKLIIHNCFNVAHHEVRLLQEIVADVEWDEIIQTQDYDDDDDFSSDEFLSDDDFS